MMDVVTVILDLESIGKSEMGQTFAAYICSSRIDRHDVAKILNATARVPESFHYLAQVSRPSVKTEPYCP